MRKCMACDIRHRVSQPAQCKIETRLNIVATTTIFKPNMNTIQRMTAVIRDIHAMPYFKNYAAASGVPHNLAKHEDAVELILSSNGFNLWNPAKKEKPSSEDVWKWINWSSPPSKDTSVVSKMPDFSYMAQPCGTHDSPDYLIKLDNNIFFGLECKSAAKNSPMYNSGGIKQNLIYAFCSEKTNETTIYVGEDIMTNEQQRLIDELIEQQRELEREFNEKLKLIDVHHRGVSYYTRPMIIQSGGASFIDYFTHPERKQCEENVYKYIERIIGMK